MSIPTLETPYAGEWPWICIHRPTQPPFMDCAFPRFGLNDGCVAGHRSVAIASERALLSPPQCQLMCQLVQCWYRSCLRLLRKEGVDLVGRHASHWCSLGGIAENTSFIAAVRDPEYPSVTLGPSPLSLDFSDF